MNLNQLIIFLRYKTRFAGPYVCVYGDPGYMKYHLNFYHFWKNEIKSEVIHIMKLVDLVAVHTTSKPLFITDLIHYGKNRRTRLIFNNIIIHPTDPSFFLDVGKIQKAIDLGDILTDLTSLGKNQDLYPIGLFSIPGVKSLMDANAWHETLYIIPVALCIEAVRNKNVDKLTRILFITEVIRENQFKIHKYY
ncbi:hypothetical protein TRFO_41760 [Tritrichomonas foetus]|uniref:Uncharacterized protein n=1 Tax=Tritrichomonas foetus TaxID=1144522 RepID=A0A1J4L3F7_9EUKA|nr:hypothetical protein TRFO_41760 [Tritrichomonas foetus]|eukprot:OHT16508.1 hypothetical protein TRFO_41760 [Tritrichomonas foetus]